MEKEFTKEEMSLIEEDVLMHHLQQNVFAHPSPFTERGDDAYWSHIIWDWAGINYGINDPENYPLHEPVFYKRVINFIKKNLHALTNREGDYLFLMSMIWSDEFDL